MEMLFAVKILSCLKNIYLL